MSGQLRYTSPFINRQGDCPPIDQLRIDNWPEKEDTMTRYVRSVNGGPFRS
jgi:hypothetical protein